MNLEFLVWLAILVAVGIAALVWMATGELAEVEPLPDDWMDPAPAGGSSGSGELEPAPAESGAPGRAGA